MNESFQYRWSDAWLLLSVLYASREQPAGMPQIIAAGDYINHAIFTDDELESGFFRLVEGKWITETSQVFSPTTKALKIYQNIRQKNLTAFEEEKELENVLKAVPWHAQDPLPHPENCFRYPNFSAAAVEKAIREYQKESAVRIRNLMRQKH